MKTEYGCRISFFPIWSDIHYFLLPRIVLTHSLSKTFSLSVLGTPLLIAGQLVVYVAIVEVNFYLFCTESYPKLIPSCWWVEGTSFPWWCFPVEHTGREAQSIGVGVRALRRDGLSLNGSLNIRWLCVCAQITQPFCICLVFLSVKWR